MTKMMLLFAVLLCFPGWKGIQAAEADTGKAVDIAVQKVPGNDFGIGHVTATLTGSRLKVWGSGRLRNQYESGHIDIGVMDTTGAKIKAFSVEAERRARGSRSTIAQSTLYFSGNISLSEAGVDHVVVAFHRDRAAGKPETFDCGANKATLNQGGK